MYNLLTPAFYIFFRKMFDILVIFIKYKLCKTKSDYPVSWYLELFTDVML